jgi:hypothetical protein
MIISCAVLRISDSIFTMTKRKNPAAVALGRRGGKATAAKLTPETRAEMASRAAKERWGAFTLEERSALAKKRWDKLTPEQWSKRVQKAAAARMTNSTPEQRSARAKKASAALTPEQRSARAKKGWANVTPEQRERFRNASAAALATSAKHTREQRSGN